MNDIKKEFFIENNIEMVKEYYPNGTIITREANPIKNIKPISQLDRIESMVAKSQEEIAQEARDAYTLELIEGGVIA